MTKKKTSLLLSVLLLVLGGLMFHVHRMSEEEKLQAQILKKQEQMVLCAINHYEGIEKIEFLDFKKDDNTGTWDSAAIINEEFYVTFVYWGEGDITIYGGKSQTGAYLVPKTVTTDTDISDIQVTYYKELP